MKEKGGEYIWFDGKFVKWEDAKVPVYTHAMHYGTAVFEGIRGYGAGGNIFVFRLKEHMERLHRSAGVYSFSLKHTVKELADATVELLQKNKMKESVYIRPLTFVGMHGIDLNVTTNSPTHTIIIAFPFAKYFKEGGISACVSSWRRINDQTTPPLAKAAGNYLNSILATQESRRNGYDESIMLDIAGNVSEASGENLFLVRNKKIYTPFFADSALEGITRDTAMTIARSMGYTVTERPIPRAELYMADEIFLTGTAAEIIPVTSVDGHAVGTGKEGPVSKSVRQAYEKVVTGGVKEHMDWLTPVW
ncbi:branched-chain amino acid transaminase [Candidatus Nitrososphaera sp. FF02]|uniref:branched-chain amino acid transaminase n=1 Tax=Candidatus Nitrososphaera sp. FF02 TaxID=3398226 RepID=UPI0039ED4E1F